MPKLHRRVIPVLLLDRRHRVVKTVRFGEGTYIGDPINVVRIFNEKEVDELCVLDIDATRDGRGPDDDFIAKLASECFMPLTYGGGIRAVEQAETLMRLGVEKFVVGSGVHVAGSPSGTGGFAWLTGRSRMCGRRKQRQRTDRQDAQRSRGRSVTDVLGHVLGLQNAGVGEIVLQSIDRDGMRGGYDLGLVASISAAASVPVVALGGAGSFDDLPPAIEAGASAVASGSAFVFVGRLRGVLITYPSEQQLRSLP